MGRRDAAIVYLAAEIGIPLEVLCELDVRSFAGDSFRIGSVCVELPEPGARLLHAWLDLRGSHPGPLFTPVRRAGEPAADPLTMSALRAVLTRRCMAVGIVPFTAADILRTRQARLCGRWTRSCCQVPYGPLPAIGELEPQAVRALGRMGTEKRSRTTKLLSLFAAQLRPPKAAMAVRWAAISDDEIESAIARLSGKTPPRQLNAVRRAVLLVRSRAANV